jgi:hypothetical protein
MNALRGWILLLAGMFFLSGLACGVLLTLVMRPAEPPQGPFADYRELLAAEFELSAERRRGLAGILERYQRELEVLQGRQAAAIEPELRRLGLQYRDLIRDYVLPESERARFDALAAAQPWPSAAPASAAPPPAPR